MWILRRLPATRVIGGFCLLAALAALAVAVVAERYGGLVPCALCLVERWPYRIAIVLGLLAALLPRSSGRLMVGLVVLAMLGGAGVAVVHVGVEQGLWPSPLPECAAPRLAGGSIAERLASMPERPAKPCDDPTYLVPGLPISMTMMNLIYSLAIGTLVTVALIRTQEHA